MMRFLPISQPSLTNKEREYLLAAFDSGWVSSLGQFIDKFEADFAQFCETKYAVTVANGTVGLHLALIANEIGPGDEVIIPDLTFVATANAVRYAGATPVFADIDESTLCLSPESVAKKMTANTKAIMPVHLYGHPADMAPLMDLAEKNNLIVIEDAAEAHGARYRGRRVGGIGQCGVFSFYGNKVITTGEGGMITTNDKDFYQRCRYLRDHAMSKEKRYWHTEVGYNYRITNLQAALGCGQLERIETLIQRRKDIFKRYEKNLKGHAKLRLNPQAEWAENIYWMICVESLDPQIKRDELLLRLKEKGVDSRPYFYPISQMPMYKTNSPSNDLSVSEKISARGFNLPSYFSLADEDIDYICQSLISLID